MEYVHWNITIPSWLQQGHHKPKEKIYSTANFTCLAFRLDLVALAHLQRCLVFFKEFSFKNDQLIS